MKRILADKTQIPGSDDEGENHKKGLAEIKKEIDTMKTGFEDFGMRLAEATNRTQEALTRLTGYDAMCKEVIERNFVGIRSEFDGIKQTFQNANGAIEQNIMHQVGHLELKCTHFDELCAQMTGGFNFQEIAGHVSDLQTKVEVMETAWHCHHVDGMLKERDALKEHYKNNGMDFPISSTTHNHDHNHGAGFHMGTTTTTHNNVFLVFVGTCIASFLATLFY